MKKLSFVLAGLVMLPTAFAGAYTIKDLRAQGAKNKFCDYDVTVPQLFADPGENQAALAKLNAKWRKDYAADIKDYKEAVSDQDSCKDDMSGYNVSLGYEVKERNGRILSIVFTESIYSGGAHPNTGSSTAVADTLTGEMFPTLSSFVDDAKVPALFRLIDVQLPKIDEGFDATFGWNDWKKEHTKASNITNFYFSGKGLTILFNPYEIASYAEGILEPTITWEQLNRFGLLKSTGPAALLLRQGDGR